jgi:hypothetical protein
MPFNKIDFPSCGGLTIVANPRLPEYRNGGKVSFELNGFCVLQNPSPFFHGRVIENKDAAGNLESITCVFLGRPNTKGEFRYAFKHPVSFGSKRLLFKLPNGSKPTLKYMKDAQILQISLTFPSRYYDVPDAFMKLLNKKERHKVTDRAFMPVGMKLEISR